MGYIVDAESAAPIVDVADRCGIMATHSGIVKFRNQKDHGYRVVHAALARLIKTAPERIKMRWLYDQQLLAEERWKEADEKREEAKAIFQTLSPDSATTLVEAAETNELYLVRHRSSHYFTGRRSFAGNLRDKFNSPIEKRRRNHHRIFVVYGLGGLGKLNSASNTQRTMPPGKWKSIAFLPFTVAHSFSYWGVFWIDASNEENAEAGFSDLGQQAGKGATFAAGIHWLSSCSKPWFLVLDNADDPDMDVSKYFPSGDCGHILITTRNPEVIEHATIGQFRFRGMDPEEAITLLLKSAHANESDGSGLQSRILARGIASGLGYLALALTHAGATIRRKIYTLERYLNYYLGQRKKMISYPQISTANDANIITTWEIPFQKIVSRKTTTYNDAVVIMHIFAFMHFESIPEIIFRMFSRAVIGTNFNLTNFPEFISNKSVWDEESDARIRRALRVLSDYSIVDHEPGIGDQGFCALHPVVHVWTRGRLTTSEQKRWVGITASILSETISPNLEASGRQFRRHLIPHIESCVHALRSLFPLLPENIEQAAHISRFALVYAENGLWKRARDLQLLVVSLRKEKLGRFHEDTMIAQGILGYIYWNLFDIRPAIEVQYSVVQSRWVCRPSLYYWATWPPWKPIHLSYCMALNEITGSLWLAGIRDRSKQTGEKALKGLMLHYGPDDPKTLDAMFNLARTYLHVANYGKCLELLVQVVNKRKRYFGPEHPDTLMARNELGMCFRAVGRLAIAERLVYNVFQSRRKILGEEHAYTLWSVNDLSKILCDRGRPRDAASMLEQIIPVVIRTLGEEHVGMGMTKSNLARAYGLMNSWAQAEVLLRDLTLLMPPDHPDYMHAMHGYAHVLYKTGRKDEAEKACQSLLDIIGKTGVLGFDHPCSIAIAGLVASIYRSQERWDDIATLKSRVPLMTENDYNEDGPFELR